MNKTFAALRTRTVAPSTGKRIDCHGCFALRTNPPCVTAIISTTYLIKIRI